MSQSRISRNTLFGKSILFVYQYSLVILTILSFAVLVFNRAHSHVDTKLRSFTLSISAPIISYFTNPFAMIVKTSDFVVDLSLLYKQNEKLKSDNSRLKTFIIESEHIRHENQRLKELVNFQGDTQYNYITTRILINSNGIFTRTATINIGKQQNIKKGAAVVSGNGFVGRVMEINENNSTLLLISDVNSRIPIITSKSRERGILAGRNIELPIIKYLPEESLVEEDEIIMTSGDGGIYPFGIPIGRVVRNAQGEYEAVPFVDWARLEFVKILVSSEQGN
jgi:rod shape-determining protein MreC